MAVAVASALVFGVAPAWAQESGAVPRGAEGAVIAPPEKDSVPKPVVKPPELVEFVHADYPKAAFEQGLQASVGLKLTVSAEGSVTAVEVTEPAGHGFDEAASAAAMKFRYTPATRDGRPFAVKIPYVYRFTITLVEQPPPPPPTRGNLTGQLRIAGTDAPLVNAPVVLKLPDGSERALTTDATGRFRLDDVPPGTARISVALDGFEPVTSDETVAVGEETDVTLRLTPKSEGLEIIVRGERPPREVTRRTVERREMERIPGTSGDALRSLQNLPGVARPPGLAGLLIVRGSGPQDTVTFVDGVDVPIIYHFFGLTSVIPTELLDRIDFFPGNFSARYGRVGGGIVDARLRSPDTRCYSIDGKLDPTRTGCVHGLLQMDLVDGRFLLQGPLPLDGWSFAVAGRRSWLDSWLKPVLREAGSSVATAPVYYDYQLIADRRTATSQTSLRFFGSDDRMALIINDPLAQDPAFGGNLRFGTAFYRAQFLHESELNSVVSVSTSVAVGKDMADFQLGNFFFNFQSLALLWRYELGFKLFRGAKLNLGLDFQASDYEVNVRLPAPPRPGEPDPGPFVLRPPLESHQSGFGFRPSWYGELELEPFDRLRIVPGLRADYYRDANHGDLAPRVSGRYDLVKGAAEDAPERRRTTLKAGAGLFYQPPEYQETDEVFGTPDLLSNRAAHYTLGIEQELTRQIDVSVEGFYKDFSQLVSRRSDLASATGYAYANEGDGHAMGLETLLKYKPDERFFGWVAYTLSRSVRRDNPDEPEHLFQYDQTHNLIMLGSYRLGRGWEFGARFRLVSGALATPLVPRPSLPAIYAADAGSYVPIEGRPYSRRLPLFHQLDLRIDKRWQLKRARLSAYLDVQNVYNNPSAEQLLYNFDFSKSSYQTGLPIIPSLGFRLEI